ETRAIAEDIRKQIGIGGFMTLGASALRHGLVAATQEATPLPSLIFNARILPFTKAGQRSDNARIMSVVVSLNGADYYDVKVTYNQRGDRYGTKPRVVHFETTDVDAFTIGRLMVALDFDGDTATNPSYFTA
ncbi:MAG: hypothetical protein L0H93_07935, partial [Nocardioides sp.]|nr:hypothetical protein [Nocardioides sp.]